LNAVFTLYNNLYPLFQPDGHRDIKDPCPVFDGKRWHIFGSGGDVRSEQWGIFHASSTSLNGPWTQHATIYLHVAGSGIAAPGIVYENGIFQMFVQTEFLQGGGTIEYFLSNDGDHWYHVDTLLRAIENTDEHGIYDPHPAVIKGQKYIVYSAFPAGTRKPQPDLYLAKSKTNEWEGPWIRLGKILDHTEVSEHHNARDQSDYEWGIEGAQLIELPDGRVLLNAVSFLPQGAFGSRQRVFFAVADSIMGPYRSLGIALPDPTEPGENGHASGFMDGDDLVLCYQQRLESTNNAWLFGLARYNVPQLSVN
jgi:hypothetical protein